MKTISVIIPCYNEELYIEECIISIISQPLFLNGRLELIVIDDGSTDASAIKVNQEFEKLAEPLRQNAVIISSNHNGLAIARNIGLSYASGNYIMFVDGDDSITPQCTNDFEEIIINNCPDVIIGLIEGRSHNSPKDYRDPLTALEADFPTDDSVLIELCRQNMKISPSVKYVFNRTHAIKEKLNFVNILHEDQLWSPRLLCSANTFYVYKKYFYNYRLSDDGLSSNFSLAVASDYLKICEILNAYSKLETSNNKQTFLLLRCVYLLNKICKFAIFYTTEEQRCLADMIATTGDLISNGNPYISSEFIARIISELLSGEWRRTSLLE